ncbi:MAG: hypothetical protein GXO10_00320 [Crenarchaeota archaeon]|nr:hypothetical protein [Thermoproteota archaeon]
MWNIELLRTIASKLNLGRRILLQEYPSLLNLAKIADINVPMMTLVNSELNDVEKKIFEDGDVRYVKIFRDNVSIEALKLIEVFRHYCFAKNLVELGYSNINQRIVETIVIEFPLFNLDYCRDEIHYVYDRLRKINSRLLWMLSRYPISKRMTPLDVLAYILLDLNLIGARSIINEFFINFMTNPELCTLRLLISHLLYVFLPAVSNGSLVKISNILLELIRKYVPINMVEISSTYHEFQELSEEDTIIYVTRYRSTLQEILKLLDTTTNIIQLPRLIEKLAILEKIVSGKENYNVKYMIILLSPPKSKTAYNSSVRYIKNFGLLVKVE